MSSDGFAADVESSVDDQLVRAQLSAETVRREDRRDLLVHVIRQVLVFVAFVILLL